MDAAWPIGGSLELAQSSGTDAYGVVTTWQLVPRSIPPMEETLTRFTSVRRSEGVTPNERFLRGSEDLMVPPRTRATSLLDQGHLTTAFLGLETSQGAGAVVS